MTLTLATDNFDRVNTFHIEIAGRRGAVRKTCSLHRDYEREGDGVYWGLQDATVIKAVYSAADIAERDRLAASEPVRHGDIVTIDGQQYAARILGNYSNAVVFDPVTR